LNKVFVDYDDSKVDVSEIMLAVKWSGYGNLMTSAGSNRPRATHRGND
jgi:hypothetical protein